jgi:ligand-binding sensor domain-containing protein
MGPGITAFLEEDSTIIWLGTNNGLIRQNRKTGVSKNYSTDILNKTSISHNSITSIFRDRRGNIWIGTQQGLNRYNKNTELHAIYAR